MYDSHWESLPVCTKIEIKEKVLEYVRIESKISKDDYVSKIYGSTEQFEKNIKLLVDSLESQIDHYRSCL